MQSYGIKSIVAKKREPYGFGIGKREPYGFGIGKRDQAWMKRQPYNFDIGNREDMAAL